MAKSFCCGWAEHADRNKAMGKEYFQYYAKECINLHQLEQKQEKDKQMDTNNENTETLVDAVEASERENTPPLTTYTVDQFASLNSFTEAQARTVLRGLALVGFVDTHKVPKKPGERGRQRQMYSPGEQAPERVFKLFGEV